jgi:hypothetical protein
VREDTKMKAGKEKLSICRVQMMGQSMITENLELQQLILVIIITQGPR